jgi:hypothetical protein
MAYLGENLQDGSFTVISANRDAPSPERKLCCVFSAPTPRAAKDPGAFLSPSLIVRAWLPKPAQPRPRGQARRQDGTGEPDPAELEQLEMDMWAVLTATRELPEIGMYFEVMETVQDLDNWGVQATLIGWVQRPLP